MGEKRNAYRILVGKPEGPVEGSCEHGIEPSGSIKWWGVFEGLHN
jgi:hypothetical protein